MKDSYLNIIFVLWCEVEVKVLSFFFKIWIYNCSSIICCKNFPFPIGCVYVYVCVYFRTLFCFTDLHIYLYTSNSVLIIVVFKHNLKAGSVSLPNFFFFLRLFLLFLIFCVFIYVYNQLVNFYCKPHGILIGIALNL